MSTNLSGSADILNFRNPVAEVSSHNLKKKEKKKLERCYRMTNVNQWAFLEKFRATEDKDQHIKVAVGQKINGFSNVGSFHCERLSKTG